MDREEFENELAEMLRISVEDIRKDYSIVMERLVKWEELLYAVEIRLFEANRFRKRVRESLGLKP